MKKTTIMKQYNEYVILFVTMKVIIDERERDLYDKCSTITMCNSTYVQIEKEVLPLGDIFLKTDEDKDVLMIERKSLSDLLASIKDGRYEEQSYRMMHSSGFPPHSVVYIIEGQFSQLRTPMERRIVYSAMASLQMFKGFSVIRTMNLQETADYIIWTAEKIERNFLKGIFPYYLQPQYCKYMKMPVEEGIVSENIEEIDAEIIPERNVLSIEPASTNELHPPAPNYCTVVKKVKKENITPENIGEIILSQIPGISAITAIAIMKKFSGFPDFMKSITENPACLDGISYESKGKTRKISKACVESIKKFFLPTTIPTI